VDLADFVLARLAEEEHDWLRLANSGGPADPAVQARLTNCRARRTRVTHLGMQRSAAAAAADTIELQLLALPYYDHPDYKPQWRPRSTLIDP